MKYQLMILPALLFTALACSASDRSNTSARNNSTMVDNAAASDITTTDGTATVNTADKDNTRINKRDQKTSELTADQQTSGTSDMDITRRIRQDIMKESSFSTYAQNVKVITAGGKVTVKGPVRTDQERSTIMKLARQVAGATNVRNEMAVEKK